MNTKKNEETTTVAACPPLSAGLGENLSQEALLHCGISRAEWHDRAWALYHKKQFEDVALGKLSIHTIRTVFDVTYDALKSPNGRIEGDERR